MSNARIPKRATIYDVAEAAGVSYQTVSRVINNSPHVSPRTQNRVMHAIRELDYRPNKAAQLLMTHRSNLIELVALDLFTGAPAIDTMASTAKALGYKLMISVIGEDDLEATANDALGRSVDGFIFISSSFRVTTERYQSVSRNVPFVRMIAESGSHIPSIIYDQRAGIRLVMQHLLDLGHRQIAEIQGPMDSIDGMLRHESWLAILREYDLQPGPSATGDFSERSGYAAANNLLASGQMFTAITASNDAMALGAMRALAEHGLRVPDAISVVGFDDSNFAAFTEPPLTTLRQDWPLMAQLATEYLVSRIEKPDTPIYQHVLIPELIVRQSTRRIG